MAAMNVKGKSNCSGCYENRRTAKKPINKLPKKKSPNLLALSHDTSSIGQARSGQSKTSAISYSAKQRFQQQLNYTGASLPRFKHRFHWGKKEAFKFHGCNFDRWFKEPGSSTINLSWQVKTQCLPRQRRTMKFVKSASLIFQPNHPKCATKPLIQSTHRYLSSFSVQYLLIKFALPQAAQLSMFFQENQQCCTSMMDLIKDAPRIGRKSPVPGGIRSHDLSVR